MKIKSLFFVPRWRGILYAMRNPFKSSYHLTVYKPILFTDKTIKWSGYVTIFPNARIQGVERYLDNNYTPLLVLKNGVSIQQNCHITYAKSIEIGEETAIAANVTITDIDHPYQNIDLPVEKQPLEVMPVKIGKDCKVYNNAVILQGTTIGNHCVIGANSVVKGHFPAYCIIVGAPAKIVKRYNPHTSKWEKTNPDGSFITNE